jgi:hypothetical protein
MVKIFGREPAAWLALVAITVKLISAFVIEVSPDAQSAINAVAAAAVGLLVAFTVHDGVIAAILGFVQAAVALAVGLGVHLPADRQALLMTAIQVVVAMFVRTQVTAPVTAAAMNAPSGASAAR